jgi:heme oxygenase (biliverdin-IX-beta and delta-forming)
MSSFHARLKTITKPLHDEIEQNRFSKALLGESPDIQTYTQFLVKLLSFLEPIEKAMMARQEWIEFRFSDICRLKSDEIRHDLKILGVSSEQIADASILPNLTDFWSILGAWYVLEGSMVGASMQAPILRKGLGIDEKTGMKYMFGAGERTLEVWRSFMANMESVVQTPQAQKAVILAACDTFLSLCLWFEEK